MVFSHPTIGTIGMTEEEAVAKFGSDQIKTFTSTFVNLFYGPMSALDPADKPKTAMKLVCLGEEEKVGTFYLSSSSFSPFFLPLLCLARARVCVPT